ncbi:hypothetical protein OA501_00565 [Flavobacteriaceae bacterium]|nr:hypothetical protein [Flavobacteriaceae bacterium]
MRNKLFTLLLSASFLATSCDKDAELVEIPASQIQTIVDAAVQTALATIDSSNSAIANAAATAAADAATAAVIAGLAGQQEAIDAAVAAALAAAAEAAANAPAEPEFVGIEGGVTFIDGSATWTNDRIWMISGKIVVRDGGVLNIQEGTIIKANIQTGVDATVLVIAAGGTINAVGTATAPIIFTDYNDEITYADNGVSPNRLATDRGRWGSIVVLGNAIVGEDGGSDDIEGIAEGNTWTQYGGTDGTESSGRMEYVSIRHSGQEIGGGNELQGLTLGGVGSGTIIENIEIVGSEDDGIEIFGGSVNVTNLMIYFNGDDAIDLDEGYNGTIDNVVIVMDADTDNAFEIDGTEDSTGDVKGEYTLQNVTVYGNSTQESSNPYGHWKSDATGLNSNIVYKNFLTGKVIEGIDADTYAGQGTVTAVDQLLFNEFDFVGTETLTDVIGGTVADASTWAEVVASQVTGTGADESVFGWTLYYQN